MKTAISILLATYNSDFFLRPQLDSLLVQSYQDFTIYIRDDGSLDKTVDTIMEYQKRYPNKIVYFEYDGLNLGACRSFMWLLEKVNSLYYMFCDHDDIWCPNKIENTFKLMQEAERKTPDIPILAHTDLTVVDNDLNIISTSFWKYTKLKQHFLSKFNYLGVCNGVTGCTMMINRKVKEIVLPIHPNAPMHDYWIALKVAHVGKIVYLNSTEVLYRQHLKNEIGAKTVGYSYFFSKLKYLKATLNGQLSIYPLLKDIGYGSIVKYYWFKMKYFIIRNI